MFFISFIAINFFANIINNILGLNLPIKQSDNSINNVSDLSLCFVMIKAMSISPVLEEIYFRGIFLLELKENCNIVISFIFSVLLFTILDSYSVNAGSFFFAILMAVVALKTNSIFYTILGHIIHNVLATTFIVIGKYTNLIQVNNGKIYFNNTINIISIISFSVFLFLMYKKYFNEN